MIKIVADNYIKKERKGEFLELASGLIEASRNEVGCISYSLYEDLNDENHLTFIEEWKDDEAIKTHNSSEYFTTIVPKFGEICSKEGRISVYKEAVIK